MSTLMTKPETEVNAEPQRRRFTIEEFQRMGEAGIFAPEERVELIKGEVVRMTPLGPRHMEAVFALDDVLRPIAGPARRSRTGRSWKAGTWRPAACAHVLLSPRAGRAR